VSVPSLCFDFDFLVVAKIRDELFHSVGQRFTSLRCVYAMKSDPFSTSLMHDRDCVAVMHTDNSACEVLGRRKSCGEEHGYQNRCRLAGRRSLWETIS